MGHLLRVILSSGVAVARRLRPPEIGVALSGLAGPIRVNVAQEKAGSEPAHFIPVVGNWLVVPEGGKSVLMVDGRQGKKGQPAGGLADKARLICGSRHEEFIDNVKAFAYFPYAVAQGIED